MSYSTNTSNFIAVSYTHLFHKENLSISTKKVYKSSDTEKYVNELKDNSYIETVFIKRRDGGTVCVSTQVGCSVGCIFCESGRNGFVRNLTPSEIVQQVVLIRQKVNRIDVYKRQVASADRADAGRTRPERPDYQAVYKRQGISFR